MTFRFAALGLLVVIGCHGRPEGLDCRLSARVTTNKKGPVANGDRAFLF